MRATYFWLCMVVLSLPIGVILGLSLTMADYPIHPAVAAYVAFSSVVIAVSAAIHTRQIQKSECWTYGHRYTLRENESDISVCRYCGKTFDETS